MRFYAELNNFLPVELQQTAFDYSFPGPITLKEVIESMKVPISEIDMILVNGEAMDLHYSVHDSDYISVYPVFEEFDISGISQLRKTPLRNSKFIADAHLGKLAKFLRMGGFDTLYKNDYTDDAIREIAIEQSRIILTRDRDLLTSPSVTHGYYVRSIHPKEQFEEIISKFDLYAQMHPFTRCLICNAELSSIQKEEIKDEIDQETKEIFNEFFKCPGCGKIYWKGSHYDRMLGFINQKGNRE